MGEDLHLIRKLRLGAKLSEDDVDRLKRVVGEARTIPAGQDLTSRGDKPENVHFVQSGFACRYKLTEDGGRAIVALLLPGDFCDLHVAILGEMDHSIGAITNCEVSHIGSAELNAMLVKYPSINRACLWATLVDEAVLREWLVNLGRRTSDKALAHLFCEIFTRLKMVGVVADHHFHLPATQADLGDMLGISQVHVQRTLTKLKDQGLITMQSRYVQIVDVDRLMEFADFDPAYLHLERARADWSQTSE